MIEPGFVLAGRYHILGVLGRGGMGVVFRARHLGLNTEVAVKVLNPWFLEDQDADARFEREAQLSATLRHPNAVPVHDFGRADGVAYIVMAMLRGRTLRARLRRGALTLPELLELGTQLAEVLAYAHLVPIVHRDIKPENVFLEAAPGGGLRPVVVDFGLAVRPEQHGELTQHGQVFGSPPYMPPEQARGLPVGPAADVYALGCVLYEMVVGAPPFPGEGVAVITKHLLEPAPSLRGQVPDADPRLVSLVAAMLRKQPDARPTASEVRAHLIEIGSAPAPRSEGPTTRLERMVPAGTSTRATHGGGVEVGVAVGALPDDIRLALIAAGFRVVEPTNAQVVLVLGAPTGTTVAWTIQNRKVIADVEPTDVDRMSALLRGGVAAVVPQPLTVEEVVKAVRRTARRLERKARLKTDGPAATD